MKTLTEKQMDSMASLGLRRFNQQLLGFVRLELPEAVKMLDDDELLSFISAQQARASQIEVHSQVAVAQYVCLAIIYGSEFIEKPEVQELFAEPSEFSNEEKLDFLFDALEDESNFDDGDSEADEDEEDDLEREENS